MVRPRKCRMVDSSPYVTYYKPRGVPLGDLKEIHLSVEGYEAVRLADFQGLKHEDAAIQMQVSRQTFGRILSQARNTVAQSLVLGWALRIQGGDYTLAGQGVIGPASDRCKAPPAEAERTDKNRVASVKTSNPIIQEIHMDKIAVTSEGPTLDDLLDPRFGRAAGFVVVDPQTLEFGYIDNGASQTMAQGAGIQAAENVANSGAKAVLTGYVGPKAFMALDAAGIKVGQNLENMTVRQAIAAYVNGDVAWAQQPNRQGHGR